MKHILLTTMAVAFAWIGFAQLQPVNAPIIFENENFHPSNNYRTTACGPDTVQYAMAKATGLTALSINNATSAQSAAQYFDCPQDITINGFDFYGYKLDATGGTSMSITAAVYLAGPDSMPSGAALASTTITVDTTFAGGNLDVLRKHANFAPVSLNQAYCLVVSNLSATGFGLIANDYNATPADGGAEWLSSLDLFGTWTRSYGVNVGGTTFDADWLLEPHVEYDLTSAFTQGTTCVADSGDFTTFTNTSSPILWNRMYNQAVFQGLTSLSSSWDFGDGSPAGNAVDTFKTYHSTGPWIVTLSDTLYGWSTTCSDMFSMSTADPSCFPCADTLLFEDFQSQMIPASWGNFDNDGLTPNNPIPSDWYTRVDDQTTSPGDTNYVAAATSWFTPLGTANNLLVLDPVAICDPAMEMIWKSAPFEGPGFADGYAVLIDVVGDTAGPVEVMRFAEDVGGGAGTWGPGVQHTNWNGNRGVLQEWSMSLGAYNGQTIEISFLHDSDDDNIIQLDDIFVGVCNAPVADFNNSINGLSVDFTDQSTNMPTSWLWDFGDGNTSTMQNPTHTYAVSGTYTVCLTTTNSCGTDSSCASIPLCIEAAPSITGFSNVSHQGMTVNWSSATLAPGGKFVIRYHEFGDSPNFGYKVIPNVAANSGYVNGLDPNTRYVFRVGAKCATQNMASFSDTASVWTRNLCPQPTGMSDSVSFNSAILSWDDMGADYYKVKYRPVGGSWTYNNTATNFHILSGLDLGTQYEWKVRSVCNDGGNRPYAATQMFMTAPARLAAQGPEEFNIYPNPSTGQVTVEFSSAEAPAQLILTDVSGRTVHSESIMLNPNFRQTFNFEVEEGSYLLRVVSENLTETIKLEIH